MVIFLVRFRLPNGVITRIVTFISSRISFTFIPDVVDDPEPFLSIGDRNDRLARASGTVRI
jgi:hypothetical protein